MSDEFLGERRRALEDHFFAHQSEERIRELRERHEREGRSAGLASASGISNREILDSLVAVGMQADTLAALSLLPLIAVAWADGQVEARERDAILKAARDLAPDGASHDLLESWLGTQPGPELVAAWRDYIRGLSEQLDAGPREALRHEIVGRARAVAEAAGGFLGLGNRVSAVEEKVLAELDSAFA